MALVTYIGQPAVPDNHREETTQFGLTFKLGEPIEIADEETVARIRGNPFYEIVEDYKDGSDGGGASSGGPKAHRSSRDRSRKPAD